MLAGSLPAQESCNYLGVTDWHLLNIEPQGPDAFLAADINESGTVERTIYFSCSCGNSAGENRSRPLLLFVSATKKRR